MLLLSINHMYLLLEPPKGNLFKMMQVFQTSYTAYFNKCHGRSGHVFERRYKAFVWRRIIILLRGKPLR